VAPTRDLIGPRASKIERYERDKWGIIERLVAKEGGCVIDRLRADGPAVDLVNELDLFGRFVGNWDLEWHGRDHSGSPIVVLGELSFGWILGGTAIQDIWRVPLDPADRQKMRAFYGTTIRFYDRSRGAWRSTWIDPLNGRVRRFTGRPLNDAIVLEGIDDDLKERWTFRDIALNGFIRRGESSVDGGRTASRAENRLVGRTSRPSASNRAKRWPLDQCVKCTES
jgi:hypothetical protein